MRPEKGDYSAYYETYISKVTGNDPVKFMRDQFEETVSFFTRLEDETSGKPYSEGKWSYKETFGHIIDTERIMSYRALCIARGELKSLPGFDQNSYVMMGRFNSRSLDDLIEEYKAIRKCSLILFGNLSEEDLSRRGVANNNEVTALALAFIICGHDKHHLEVLKGYFNKRND